MLFPKQKFFPRPAVPSKPKKNKFAISNARLKYITRILRDNVDRVEKKDKAIFMANKQVSESMSEILKAAPLRALERLRFCIVSIAADILKIPPPVPIDDEIPAFCRAFKRTQTLQQMVEISVKILPDPHLIMKMDTADLIELMCFGSIRDLVSRQYQSYLIHKPTQVFTVPALVQSITESYARITHEVNRVSEEYRPYRIPNTILYPIETLVEFPETLDRPASATHSDVPIVTELFLSKFMKITSTSKNISVHPFQLLVIDIVSFIVNSIHTDLISVKKTVNFTLSSLSEYLF